MSIKLKGSTAGSVALDAPANTSPSGSDISFTLPIADGSSGQVLTTNGSGALSFANEGKITQVVSTTKTDVYSESFSAIGEGSNITGFSVTITPSSTSNKVLLTGFMSVGTNGSSEHQIAYRIYRGSTLISVGDADGSRSRVTGAMNYGDGGMRVPALMAINHLDSPSTTSSVTYNIRFFQVYATSVTLYLNRGGDTEDNSGRVRATSTITAMEVAA